MSYDGTVCYGTKSVTRVQFSDEIGFGKNTRTIEIEIVTSTECPQDGYGKAFSLLGSFIGGWELLWKIITGRLTLVGCEMKEPN